MGAVIGSSSGGWAIGKINKRKFEKIVSVLENNLEENGFWVFQRYLIDALGVTKKFFIQCMPDILQVFVKKAKCL